MIIFYRSTFPLIYPLKNKIFSIPVSKFTWIFKIIFFTFLWCGAAAIKNTDWKMSDYGRIAKIAAGVAGISFLGYCIYFDRKRRSDPLFKQKLKESKCFSQNVWFWYHIFFWTYKTDEIDFEIAWHFLVSFRFNPNFYAGEARHDIIS